jgi:hypothetical protein
MYEWQEPAIERTVELLKTTGLVVNMSDTGTGKTYVTAKALARVNHAGAFVMAPKNVRTMWRAVLAEHGVNTLDVCNIEKIRHGGGKTKWYNHGQWHLPSQSVAVVDEAHVGSADPKALSAVVVARLKAAGCALILQSATLADSPLKMRATGYLAGLHNFNSTSFYQWCRNHACSNSPFHTGLEFSKGPRGIAAMAAINQSLAPYAIRLRIEDIADFPECDTQAVLYDLDEKYRQEVEDAYEKMDEELKKPGVNPLVEVLKARQRSELAKVALLVDLANERLLEGKSVVLFVNFTDTVEALHERLGGVKIYGEQSDSAREAAKEAFQANKEHVCIANCAAGGIGVSLHDVHHERPRIAYITPPWSATVVTQVLGRVWRAGGTKAQQVFALAAGTIEESVHRAIQRKLRNLAALNDHDLTGL